MSQEYAFQEEAILRSIRQIKYAPNFLHYFQISPPEKLKAFPNQKQIFSRGISFVRSHGYVLFHLHGQCYQLFQTLETTLQS